MQRRGLQAESKSDVSDCIKRAEAEVLVRGVKDSKFELPPVREVLQPLHCPGGKKPFLSSFMLGNFSLAQKQR